MGNHKLERWWLLGLALAAFLMPAAAAGNGGTTQIIYDFGAANILGRLSGKDIRYNLATTDRGPVLRMETGTSYEWPSLYLFPAQPFNFTSFGAMHFPVKNLDGETLTLFCRIDSSPPGNPDPSRQLSRTFTLHLAAGESADFQIPIHALPDPLRFRQSDFFGMMGQPWFRNDAIYPENIQAILIFVTRSASQRHIELGSLVVDGKPGPMAVFPDRPFPLIDEFGQFRHADWPGKNHTVADLGTNRTVEAADLALHRRPLGWDHFGGWLAGPQLAATGRFHTVHLQDRWWLVDPDGRLFFSQGIDCVDFGNNTIIAERENWFEKIPPLTAATRDFFGQFQSPMQNYHFSGRSLPTFSFQQFNLSRKYGTTWRHTAAGLAHERLESWGINTIGNWSDPAITGLDRTPYVVASETAGPVIAGSAGYWGKFPDVWDPGFSSNSRNKIKNRIGTAAHDPWCIGIFVDNELSWGDPRSLGLAVLSSPPSQAAKRALSDFLQTRYPEISTLNKVWDSHWTSWNSLLQDTNPVFGPHAQPDLSDFFRQTAERYFSQIRDILGEIAPDRLYLGCRFAESHPLAIMVAEQFCDVVSFNVYKFSPMENSDLSLVHTKPILIGEFHFGALDRGLFHPGLVAVPDQAARALAYRHYVDLCLANPAIVGCHWFQYSDEPTTGRALDGENYQIGFLDIVDLPYPEIVTASRELGSRLYETRMR